MSRIWIKDANTGGWKCKMPGDVTLFAVPEKLTWHSLTPKPSRGTMWRAGCTHWHEATRCASIYGRDAYRDMQATAADARHLAERLYSEAQASRP